MTAAVHSRYRAIEGAIITLTRKPAGHAAACDGCGDGIGQEVGQNLRTVRDWAQKHAATCRAEAKPAALPDGVLHRAVTVGGGHVDITADEATAAAACTGCQETVPFKLAGGYEFDRREAVIGLAIAWTREHATCPFMPKPEGSR